MSNYLKLQKHLVVNGLYEPNYKKRLKELAEIEEIGPILKEMKHLFGYKNRYILSSINQYLRDDKYDRKVFIKIIRDKLYLVNHMTSAVDAYNGPNLEKIYATYDLDTYQLLLERFANHYIRGESTEYSALKYFNVLFGENKEKMRYITGCLMPSNISKLFELKPKKLETYLDFLSIRNSSSTDSIMEFIEMVDTFEKMDDRDFREALCFIYQDQDTKLIYERLNFLPLLLNKDNKEEDKIYFQDVIASRLSRLPKEVQRKLYQDKNVKDIIKGLSSPIFSDLLLESIRNTPIIQMDTVAELFVDPRFYTRTEQQKFIILESLRKNGEELEADTLRYQRKLNFILSNERKELVQPPFLKETLDFICQEEEEEVFDAKVEAMESFNGDFQDKNQYVRYLALLQANTSDSTDKEKAAIISSRSRYLTESSFTDFYQRMENSSNKDRFISLLEESRDDDTFFSICDVIASERCFDKDIYKGILDYIEYSSSKEELVFAMKEMEGAIIQENNVEEQRKMLDHLFENLIQTVSIGDYTLEIIGEKSLQKAMEQKEVVYTSPDCKAQIKVKKS